MNRLVKAVMLVPLRDNDGRPFSRKDWDELEQKLLQFGGFTKGSNVHGAWRSGGTVYRDKSRQYITALDSWARLNEWLAVVSWAQENFRQEAMYTEVAGIPEVIG